MADETSPFDFNTEYDEDFDAPIEQVEVAAAKESPATPVVTEQPKPAASGTEAPRHNPQTLYFAKSLGIDDDEIAGATPAELDRAVRIAHKAYLRTSQEFSRNQAKGQPKPEPEKPKEEEPDELAEFADEVAPRVLAAIKKSQAARDKEIQSLRAKVDEFEGEKKAAIAQKFCDAVDARFATMPAKVKEVIGDGHRTKVSRVQRAVRKSILEVADADTTEGASWSDKIDRATRFIVGEEAFAAPAEADETLGDGYVAPPAPAKKPVPPKGPDGKFAAKTTEEREAAWKGGGTAPPTQREPTPTKGETLALKTAQKYMIEHGMMDPDDAVLESFPK